MSGSVTMPAASAPCFPPWADLDAGLVCAIAARCALGDYASCRAVCGAWRTALPSPLSCPLAVLPAAADAAGVHPAVSLAACFHFHHARRWARLLHGDLRRPTRIASAGCCCVGASRDGWLALVAGDDAADAEAAPGRGPLLFNPFTGEEIPLDPALYEPAHEPAPKIVFSPNPTPLDFTAVSLCRRNRVAVQRASSDSRRSRIVDDTGLLLDRDVVLVDLAYSHYDGKVYCLENDGQVHVLHLNRRRRRRRVPPMEVGPLPKLPRGAVLFPPPYDTISELTDAKNLVLCDDGVLYQVWRRRTGAGNATVAAPAGGARRWIHVSEGDVFVLRFDPGNGPRGPCWSVVGAKDLRGGALFLGVNGAAVVRAGGEGVSANSVYYWDSLRGGDYEAVVYSLATGASVRWPAVSTGGASSPAWYFLPAAAGDTHRVEAQAEGIEVEDTSSGEATSPPEVEEEELDHSAHCLKKTMSLLGRLFSRLLIIITSTVGSFWANSK